MRGREGEADEKEGIEEDENNTWVVLQIKKRIPCMASFHYC
jgi:hypothetical protein